MEKNNFQVKWVAWKKSGCFYFYYYYYYFFISHPQTITIHYIYNSLQVTVIVYKKEKEGQSPQKYYSLYINN